MSYKVYKRIRLKSNIISNPPQSLRARARAARPRAISPLRDLDRLDAVLLVQRHAIERRAPLRVLDRLVDHRELVGAREAHASAR